MNNRIKELRKSISMTQEDFANRLAITKASVSRIESGVNNPSDQTIKLICSEFGVRREWLELGHEPMYAADLANGPEVLIPDLVEILSDHPAVLDAFRRIVGSMTPSDWDRLNTILDDVMSANKKGPEA